MKQSEDNLTRELPVTRAGRKPIGDRPMTAAERKARSRANAIGELDGQIAVAQECVRMLMERCKFEMQHGGISQLTVLDGAQDILAHLELARAAVPRS